MERTRVKIATIIGLLGVLLLTLAGLYDLKISENLYRGYDNILSILGGIVGKVPAYAILTFCFMVLLNYVINNKSMYKTWVNVVIRLVYMICIYLTLFMMFYSLIEDVSDRAKYIAFCTAMIGWAICIYLVTTIKFGHLEELKKWALLSIVAIGVILVLTLLFKVLWGRVRFIDIDKQGSYTPWYIPNGVTGEHSFPSGHTALFGAMFTLIPLFGIFRLKGELFTTILIIVGDVLIGMFRILGGHHYLSDVTMSILIAFFAVFITMKIGYKSDYSNAVLSPNNVFRRI